jgi:hypothetical protein
MSDRRESSHPPSDPRPGITRGGGTAFLGEERPVRIQLIAALLLGLVLVASGLYLWRRPHTPSQTPTAEGLSASDAALVAGDAGAPVIAAADAGSPAPVMLSDARVLGCHDRGPKKTPPEECDHLASVEQALTSAITQAASCVPTAAGGGTIEYVADVSFLHRKLNVLLPRAGRSVHDRKVLHACSTAVRGAMQGLPLDGLDHQHARYRIAITATYRGSGTGG